MKAENRRFVAIDYTLKLDSGEVVDRSSPGDPLGFIFGTGQVIPGLEKGIEGMAAGESRQVSVEPAEGYGESNPSLVKEIPRENFPEDLDIQPGMGFEARGPQGPVMFRVKSVNESDVLADFNHPLAGQRLHFDVRVEEVREPRAEELAALQNSCEPSACAGCSGSCG